MQSLMRDVARFLKACDVPVHNVPHIPPADRKALRIKLIKEEVNKELLPALEEDDLAGIADSMADSIYVIVGAALEYGIPLEVVWLAVQRANMAKVDPTTGKVLKRENGKILKPKSWTPPDIQAILGDAASGRYLAHLVEGPL